jgi:hypothetical protein
MDRACHILGCHFIEAPKVHNVFDEVASTIYQSLGDGEADRPGAVGAQLPRLRLDETVPDQHGNLLGGEVRCGKAWRILVATSFNGTFIPRLLIQMATYDVASNICLASVVVSRRVL